jgi:hypothetical protein
MNEQHITKLRDQVEYVLQRSEKAKNSDVYLWILIVRQFYSGVVRPDQSIFLKDMFELPNQDNVKRLRARFNAALLYLPTSEEVRRKRGINEAIWRTYLARS